MGKRKKILKSISVIGLASVAGLSGCEGESGEDGEGHSETSHEEHVEASGEGEGMLNELFAGEGEGESGSIIENGEAGEGEAGISTATESGEGEGGEGTTHSDQPALDDISFLTQVSLIEGHLLVGHELYQAGHHDAAETHMKHPEDELYATLIPALNARKVRGMDEELKQLAAVVESKGAAESAQAAFTSLTTAINHIRSSVAGDSQSAKQQLKLSSELLKIAAQEYALAVVDGTLENAHEYQDAYGFTTVAKSIVASIVSDNATTELAKENAAKAIDSLMPHWPALIPPATLTTEAGEIYGAAARIELISAGL